MAPLVLAASRLRRVSEGPARTEAVARWLGQHGAEVAVAPWWRSLTSAQQAFLRETAMLDRLDAPACDVVRDADDSQQLLRSITRSEGLLCRDVTTDATPRWRRHRLLTAALASRGGGGSRGERLEAHQRVAEHYVERGEVESAIFHLIEAGRYQEAGEQLRDVEVHLITTGQAELALTWYSDLPHHVGQLHRARAADRLGLLWGGDTTMVRQCLARLEAWLVSSIAAEMEAAQRAAVRGEVQLLSACLAGAMADTAGMIAAARSAVARLRRRLHGQLPPARARRRRTRTPVGGPNRGGCCGVGPASGRRHAQRHDPGGVLPGGTGGRSGTAGTHA